MAFEITNRDEHRWQLRTAEVLTTFINHGFDADLPTLDWTIASGTGALVGQVSVLDPNDKRRAAFEAWAQFLAAYGERWPEHPRMNGGTHLHLVFKYPTNRGDVKGAIRCDLEPADVDDDVEADAPRDPKELSERLEAEAADFMDDDLERRRSTAG
ncbi:hypothetical protein OG730_43990 (plasmid) [Streptomyces sp. NBC_01298]|uniref:hypothetical protein n=1 Tax=Streptomyces sp. NBC_01298 TaxID=2903817 RepID=UPI002E129EF6|nr:hypothetical protein OG730_44095 [Streptomyces sp. NBC_01298]WSK26332.1 hypothetical protein OG730_43990 [Streptomyces sp. NBC_01298]